MSLPRLCLSHCAPLPASTALTAAVLCLFQASCERGGGSPAEGEESEVFTDAEGLGWAGADAEAGGPHGDVRYSP